VKQSGDGRDDDRARPVQEEGRGADDDEVQEREDGAGPARGVDEEADEREVAQDLDVGLDLGLDEPPHGPVEEREDEGERRDTVEIRDLDFGARAELDEDRDGRSGRRRRCGLSSARATAGENRPGVVSCRFQFSVFVTEN
jgi:hypothetical protein